MAFVLSSLFHVFSSVGLKAEKIDCYHCGEKMRKTNALTVKFNGCLQPVCCHGCSAVLRTIEKNGLIQDYLEAKSLQVENKSS
ncbi:MAG: heavy metal translocating P-type ATPase metal-binding domain-containing protein [Burkholderiales bacterium]|nr:heavy metal translocating P-type ATPase metal-binding domain-containing protein [Burkholderiales bacterium]